MEENNNNNTQPSTNSLAISGFVVSLVSLFINLAGIVGLIGTIFSAIGLAQSKKKGKGKGLAIAGLIIGIISIVYGIYSIFNAAKILSTFM